MDKVFSLDEERPSLPRNEKLAPSLAGMLDSLLSMKSVSLSRSTIFRWDRVSLSLSVFLNEETFLFAPAEGASSSFSLDGENLSLSLSMRRVSLLLAQEARFSSINQDSLSLSLSPDQKSSPLH